MNIFFFKYNLFYNIFWEELNILSLFRVKMATEMGWKEKGKYLSEKVVKHFKMFGFPVLSCATRHVTWYIVYWIKKARWRIFDLYIKTFQISKNLLFYSPWNTKNSTGLGAIIPWEASMDTRDILPHVLTSEDSISSTVMLVAEGEPLKKDLSAHIEDNLSRLFECLKLEYGR